MMTTNKTLKLFSKASFQKLAFWNHRLFYGSYLRFIGLGFALIYTAALFFLPQFFVKDLDFFRLYGHREYAPLTFIGVSLLFVQSLGYQPKRLIFQLLLHPLWGYFLLLITLGFFFTEDGDLGALTKGYLMPSGPGF